MKNNTIKMIGCIIILLLISTFAVLDIALIYSDISNTPDIGIKAYYVLKKFSF
jgi:hypothetical protein